MRGNKKCVDKCRLVKNLQHKLSQIVVDAEEIYDALYPDGSAHDSDTLPATETIENLHATITEYKAEIERLKWEIEGLSAPVPDARCKHPVACYDEDVIKCRWCEAEAEAKQLRKVIGVALSMLDGDNNK